MKKVIASIVVIAIGLGAWYFIFSKNTPKEVTTKTIQSGALGISLTYPKILSASTTPNEILLHHAVTFTHHDYCDFKGEGDTTIDTLTDFHVSFHTTQKGLVDTMKEESPYIPEENFVNGEVVPSPGFIDTFTAGELKGFSIFEGAEGCGRTVYYIDAGSNKTLVIQRQWITVFSGVIDTENKAAAEAVPGVLNKEKEEQMFNSVLQSLTIQ